MKSFLEWMDRNRKPIGYTIGGLNVLMALNYALIGQFGLAVLWFVIGFFLLVDARGYK